MRLTLSFPAGFLAFLALMIPVLGRSQDRDSAGPLGDPAASFVLYAGGTNVFGSGWGSGMLTFQGSTFRFSIDGLRPAEQSDYSDLAEGQVYNLLSLNDFSGYYSTIQGGSDTGSQYLQNEHGVIVPRSVRMTAVRFRSKGQTIDRVPARSSMPDVVVILAL